MTVKVSNPMVSQYLGMVFSGWFNEHDAPPVRLEDYFTYAKWIRVNAEEKRDLVFLKAAVEDILLHPLQRQKQIARVSFNDDYGYDLDEALAVIDYIYRVTWPGENWRARKDPPEVEWLDMDSMEWRNIKYQLNPDFKG